MEKDVIYIGLEFLFGPIQKFEEDGEGNLVTGVRNIDDDELVQKFDKEINELWCSLWSNDSNEPSGMKFDEKQEKELAPQLLEMINMLIDRLNEINDGSFEIEDMITNRLKALIK